MTRQLTERELAQRRGPRRRCLQGCGCSKHQGRNAESWFKPGHPGYNPNPAANLRGHGSRGWTEEQRREVGDCIRRYWLERRGYAISPGPYIGFTKSVKQAVLQRDKVCQICGRLPTTEDRLVVHHLNYDRGDPRLDNLRALHNSCHIRGHGLGRWPIWLGGVPLPHLKVATMV